MDKQIYVTVCYFRWSMTPIMYPATFVFKESSVAYISLIILNMFTGVTSLVTTFILKVFDSDQVTPYVLLNPLLIDRILDWSKMIDRIVKNSFGTGRKYCRKRRKFWLPIFSPFLTILSKGFFFEVVKRQNCVVKT